MKEKISKLKNNPAFKEAIKKSRPSLTIWGVLGVILFFILPEIIGFWKGKEIAVWAHSKYLEEPLQIGRSLYWLIEKLFESGGSYINLSLGLALLYWMWYDWRKTKREKERYEDIKF